MRLYDYCKILVLTFVQIVLNGVPLWNSNAYYYYYYYVVVVVVVFFCHRPGVFFLVLLLSQWRSPPLRLQVSYCSTFRVMCGVPSTDVFCSECVECFPGMAYRVFLKPFVTIQLAPVVTGIIIHFMFPVRCIYIYKFFRFLLDDISVCEYCHISQYACFLFFVFIYYIWPICRHFSVCV